MCRPGPGDVIDAALKKCNVAEGKFILSFEITWSSLSCVIVKRLLLISYSPSPFSPSAPGRCNPSPQVLQVYRGLRLLLQCVQLSPRPCSWEYPLHRHTRQHNSDLEVVVTDDNLGNYVCTCQVWSHEAELCLLFFCLFLLFLLFFFENKDFFFVCAISLI